MYFSSFSSVGQECIQGLTESSRMVLYHQGPSCGPSLGCIQQRLDWNVQAGFLHGMELVLSSTFLLFPSPPSSPFASSSSLPFPPPPLLLLFLFPFSSSHPSSFSPLIFHFLPLSSFCLAALDFHTVWWPQGCQSSFMVQVSKNHGDRTSRSQRSHLRSRPLLLCSVGQHQSQEPV